MNIFKVIASGKKTLFEEQMSAVLAWLLHPQMEHGLGYAFLNRFMQEIAKKNVSLQGPEQNLKNRLRGDNEHTVGLQLEEHAGNSYIDIVLYIDEWVIGIENKIYAGSAADTTQLNREYQGLVTKYADKKCALIFLVPCEDSDGILPAMVQMEYGKFDSSLLRENEFIHIMTWQENKSYSSISSIVESILKDESLGYIEPISEYTRHTLKAFRAFIRSGFAGYDYERINEQSGIVFSKVSAASIIQKESGDVGIKGGVSGLLRLTAGDFKTRSFNYNDSDMSGRSQWLPVNIFKAVFNWRVNGIIPQIKWDYRLPSDLLYEIARILTPGQSVFIGIQGGLNALKDMSVQTISQKSWGIVSAEKAPSSQWVNGEQFCLEYEKKFGVRK